jgi:hypothetical protein
MESESIKTDCRFAPPDHPVARNRFKSTPRQSLSAENGFRSAAAHDRSGPTQSTSARMQSLFPDREYTGAGIGFVFANWITLSSSSVIIFPDRQSNPAKSEAISKPRSWTVGADVRRRILARMDDPAS